jgi:hypothetical protein
MRCTFAVATLAVFVTHAHATVLCTTPDGRTYAGDQPPPDCKERGSFSRPYTESFKEGAAERSAPSSIESSATSRSTGVEEPKKGAIIGRDKSPPSRAGRWLIDFRKDSMTDERHCTAYNDGG